jgi:mevalonate kinase
VNRIVVHGKCILAGEHAVVRGAKAVVFPLKSRSLSLEWEYKETKDQLSCEENSLAEPFRKALSRALEIENTKLPPGHFHFHLKSDIPLRAGLGSSAALSVAVARFLATQNISKSELFPLALELENIFHGTSSGIDVAATLANSPILFARGEKPREIRTSWKPELFLHDTGLRSSTKLCVEKVTRQASSALDEKMAKAAELAATALQNPNGQALLVQAMEEAADCFSAWNLIPDSVKELSENLKKRGALAVKPTGSGDGGFLLALWPDKAPEGLSISDS